jgi:hypothetical protein
MIYPLLYFYVPLVHCGRHMHEKTKKKKTGEDDPPSLPLHTSGEHQHDRLHPFGGAFDFVKGAHPSELDPPGGACRTQ